MKAALLCPRCGARLPSTALGGLCRRCVGRGLLAAEPAFNAASAPSEPEASPENIGSRIGRFRLGEKLGEGGSGVVYAADQEEPVRRRVALKVIKAGMDTKAVVARFQAEQQTLAQMDHPHIAKVFDAGATESGRPYFVMELVAGCRITEHCDQNNLPTKERLDLFVKVCQAIQHAHQKGIIHRDIKPSNVLVTLQDGMSVPKVIDFGIAKAIEGRLDNATVYTQLHQFIGTPAYMSPEQAEMTGLDIDTRSDIYSLGVLLYELLTGRTPFDAKELSESGLDAMRKTIREKQPPRPSTRLRQELAAAEVTRRTAKSKDADPKSEIEARQSEGESVRSRRRLQEQIHVLKGDLDWIVMKCLEKDRTRRYETVDGLTRDLQHHLRDEPVNAGPPSRIYKLQKFIVRNQWPVLLTATAAVLTVAGLIGTSIGLKRANVARSQADQNATRARKLALDARTAEIAARVAEGNALRQAYSASMLSAADALERAQTDMARRYLNNAPADLRGWEWRHLSSRLDLTTRIHEYSRPLDSQIHVPPDGRLYYDVSDEPAWGIRHWDIETGQLLGTIPTSQLIFGSWLVAEGKELIVLVPVDANRNSWRIEAWNLEPGTRLWWRPVPGGIQGAPDGSWVQVARDGSRVAYELDHRIYIMDTRSGATRVSQAAVTSASDGPSSVICFQPDGRLLAVGKSSGQVALLDTDSLEIVSTIEAHENAVHSMVFSADSRLLATGSLDSTIRITDVAANPPVAVATLRGHAGAAEVFCFSPNGSLLASRGQDRTLRLWETRRGNPLGVFQFDGVDAWFLPDGQALISGDTNGVRFWDARALDAWVLRGHRSYVYPVLISPDGTTIYSGGWDGFVGQPGSLRFWDATTGEAIASTGAADAYVRAAALSADGSRLAVSVCAANEAFNRIDILDTATGTTVALMGDSGDQPVNTPSIGIDSLAFDPAAQNVVWMDDLHGVVHTADAVTGAPRKSRRVFGSGGRNSRVAWSPDGATIALSNTIDSTLDILDGQTLEPVRRWPHGHGGRVCSVAFSPDSRRIVTASEDGIARIWDAATGTRLHDLVGHANRVLCAVYSPDGKRIASGGNDNNVRLWDAETFEQVARLGGHEDYVYSLAWRADSQQLISGSGDHTVRIWDTVPMKDRMQAQRERQAILVQVQPMVQRLFAELGDAGKVVQRVKVDASLGTRARQVALQVTVRMSLERRNAVGAGPAR